MGWSWVNMREIGLHGPNMEGNERPPPGPLWKKNQTKPLEEQNQFFPKLLSSPVNLKYHVFEKQFWFVQKGQNYTWTSPEKDLKIHQIVGLLLPEMSIPLPVLIKLWGFCCLKHRFLYLNFSKTGSKNDQNWWVRFAFFGQNYTWTSPNKKH